MNIHHAIAAVALALGPGIAAAQTDPLDSPRWGDMKKEFLPAAARVVFDERVRVIAPLTAENALNVPVSVDASALPDVKEVLVFADFNPIARIVRFEPRGARPRLWRMELVALLERAGRAGDALEALKNAVRAEPMKGLG